MAEDLKKETAKGVIWSGLDRLATGGVIFIANIVLARILTPNDFGLLALISIFVQVSQTLIDSGFSNALIQKKDRTQTDYSTIFYFNIGVSIGLYIILFILSPLIAKYFYEEKLESLIRVVGISLIIGSLVSVHKTRLAIQLQFKIQALISLLSSLLSSIIAVFMAYNGSGVWSLVMLSVLNISFQTIFIYLFIKWRPSFVFSRESFHCLFSYSSKLLGSSLIHLLYRNIYPIVIGKKFSPIELGYFNRADTYSMYAPFTIGNIISRVAFPIFSRIQDDNYRLSNAYSKYIVYSSLIIFPIMVELIVLAEPITLIVFKEKWLPMVPMFQILCIDWMFDHLNIINLNVLYVKGRSDLALRNEIIKKTLAFIIFFISIIGGIIGVCWGRVFYGFIAIYINSFYTKRLIGIGLVKQIKDISRPLMYSQILGLLIWFIKDLMHPNLIYLIIVSIIGLLTYIIIIYVFDRELLKSILLIKKLH